jgi:putative hemolysin
MRLQPIPPVSLSPKFSSVYSARLAQGRKDVRAAQELRYRVFNQEMGQGPPQAETSGLDQDFFDVVCDHLVVEHVPIAQIVGTYRLQPGPRASRQLGFYSASEFDLSPLAALLPESIELGRACVDQSHRNLSVLSLLWRGIAQSAQQHGARYLFGCSSISSQSPAVGASVYAELYRKHFVTAAFRTQPQPGYECPLVQLCEDLPNIPKLLRAYLAIGAKMCGPPALDREFRTIDFLTLLDLSALPAAVPRLVSQVRFKRARCGGLSPILGGCCPGP